MKNVHTAVLCILTAWLPRHVVGGGIGHYIAAGIGQVFDASSSPTDVSRPDPDVAVVFTHSGSAVSVAPGSIHTISAPKVENTGAAIFLHDGHNYTVPAGSVMTLGEPQPAHEASPHSSRPSTTPTASPTTPQAIATPIGAAVLSHEGQAYSVSAGHVMTLSDSLHLATPTEMAVFTLAHTTVSVSAGDILTLRG